MRFYITFLILLLAGCASKPVTEPIPESTEQAWEHQQQLMNEIDSWEIQGKFSIKQSQRLTSANITWRQSSPHRYEIALIGPLGQGSVLLSGYANRVVLKDARGKTDTASNAQDLLYKHTGWSLPIESLYYWVRGLPDPQYPHQYVLNEYGQLAQLQQHGWTLAYDTYQQYDGYFVPRKISLNYPATRITLLLRAWQVNLLASEP